MPCRTVENADPSEVFALECVGLVANDLLLLRAMWVFCTVQFLSPSLLPSYAIVHVAQLVVLPKILVEAFYALQLLLLAGVALMIFLLLVCNSQG